MSIRRDDVLHVASLAALDVSEEARRARDWWQNAWKGEAFMAIGMKDPVLGPPVMQALRRLIRNCPEPYVHSEGGHFLQEWGEDVAREALKRWR